MVRREDFLVEACCKYELAHSLRPRSHATLYNWGIAQGDRARACSNTTRARALWLAACDKYRAAVECDTARTQSTQAGRAVQ